MKSIVVLVDYTEGCKLALRHAKKLAIRTGASLTALHLVKTGTPHESEYDQLRAFATSEVSPEIVPAVQVADGNLFSDIDEALAGLSADLVVLCTHGVKGFAQHLFGAHILKLLHAMSYPCLVVQENSKMNTSEIKKILFPASPYPGIHSKIRQTGNIAKALGAEVVLYEINKYLSDTEDIIRENLNAAEKYFISNGIAFSRVLDDNSTMSMGFAKQTLNYAKTHGMDLISLMSEVEDHDLAMLKADKEHMVTNEFGIPVLCCTKMP